MAATKFVLWPEDQQTAAASYAAAINAYSQSTYSEQFAGDWYPMQDVNSKWVVPYYGPPAENAGGLCVEQPAFVPMRDNTELVDFVEWPQEEQS